MVEAERRGAPWPGAVAVSGGSDSLALMMLLANWAKARNAAAPAVLTVDHGLRKDSARDARMVLERANVAKLKAHNLRWRGVKPKSDIEAEARRARYRLMGAWCAKHGVKGLYVAHTLEDQAETFLLRLARGSGIDGLSAMRYVASLPSQENGGMVVVRPLLGIRRERLRGYLTEIGQSWIEDPMNADPRFARVRIRAAWPALTGIGLLPSRIAAAAEHLARAREALDLQTQSLIAEACRLERDIVFLDAARLASAPREIGMRALAAVLMDVSAADYRPRFERLERLYTLICAGQLKSGRTLHGCRIAPAKKEAAAFFGPATLLVAPEGAVSRRPDAPGKREFEHKSAGN
jgi:tRNA(Ile)-lysidine synthase